MIGHGKPGQTLRHPQVVGLRRSNQVADPYVDPYMPAAAGGVPTASSMTPEPYTSNGGYPLDTGTAPPTQTPVARRRTMTTVARPAPVMADLPVAMQPGSAAAARAQQVAAVVNSAKKGRKAKKGK